MNENFYLSIDELCTLEQTDALLTLGMGTERLYYEEQSGHYLFPLSSAIKWIRENKGINIRANYRYIARDWFADWLNLSTSEYDDTSEYYPTKEAALTQRGVDRTHIFVGSIKKLERKSFFWFIRERLTNIEKYNGTLSYFLKGLKKPSV